MKNAQQVLGLAAEVCEPTRQHGLQHTGTDQTNAVVVTHGRAIQSRWLGAMPSALAAIIFCWIAATGVSQARADDAPAVIETEGVRRLRLLEPSADNPRNSEGDFIRLRDGRILFVYTHFTGGAADHSSAHLAGRFSEDNGRTWTDHDIVVLPNEAKMNVMSVSLLRLADGRIGMLYLRKNAMNDCRPYLRISTDEAKSWGAPTLCIPDGGYFVVNNGRLVQLRNGRLVIPTSQHAQPGGKFQSRGTAMCYLSDDEGRTWRRSRTVLEAPPSSRSGLQEPGVVELRDGRLMMFCRIDQGSQFVSYSDDGGETWSPPKPSSLISPVSPATIKRIPSTGDLLVVYNNHAGIDPSLRGKRTPLTIAVSKDEGQTWQLHKNIEDDPNGWYCYTAMMFVDKRVLLAYCGGDRRTGGLNATVITQVDLEWIYR